MSLYLCVDCGGSKTSAVITSLDGTIVGRGLGGPSNFAYLGPDLFGAAVESAVSAALKTVTEPPSVDPVALPPQRPEHTFAVAWFGVSGIDSPAAVDAATPVLSRLLGIPAGPRLRIANDTELLAAPLSTHPDVRTAVTAIAGTGSCVVSFGASAGGGGGGGLEVLGRTGGWGWILGDDGGGFHVGREAIRQLLLEVDTASLGGAPAPNGPNTMHAAVLRSFGVSDPLEILTAVHVADPPAGLVNLEGRPEFARIAREKRLSRLAPLVFDAAFKHGDPLAMRVLRVAAAGLADQIALMVRAGDDAAAGDRRPRASRADEAVLCFGGSLVGVEAYRKLVLESLAERNLVFRYVEWVEDVAAVGAASLAVTARKA